MRSGAHRIRTKFTAGGLTHFGGIYLLHRFFRRLHLRWFLQQHIAYPQRNNHYSLSEILLALMYPMILGLEKIEVSSLLKMNGVFQYMTGLPTFPDPQTFRRFLLRSAPAVLPQLRRIHDLLRAHFLVLPRTPSSFWLDCDSTVRTLYGKQEGAEKGYNPLHTGKRSYHPLLITEAHLGDCLGSKLRYGNAHTADGISDLLDTSLGVLPHRNRLRLRADCGFYEGNFVHRIGRDMEFAIVAKMTAPLQRIVPVKRYKRVSRQSKFATAQFRYTPHGWHRQERFIALRRELPSDDEQPTLFSLDRYAYSVLVTNLTLMPYDCFSFYRDHAGVERIIRTLKEDYPFGSAPTRKFEANELYAELSVLAYNLIIWFRRLCLPESWQSYTLPTIRYKLLMTPGDFVRTGNVPTLRFPRNSPYKDVFEHAQEQIEKLDPLL